MPKKISTRPLWHPALWPAWIAVFVLYLLSRPSMATKYRWGASVGRLLNARLKSRRKVVLRNLEVCFPDMPEAQRRQLAEENFIATARGAFETIHSWWCDVGPEIAATRYVGLEHLEDAKSRGKGIFLIGGHYAMLDLALPLIACKLENPGYMYRPNDNPVLDRMIENGRRRHYGIKAFTKRDTAKMVRFLEKGGSVWYACDQDFGRRAQLFVPFFGVLAGVIDAPSRIARDSGATVICVSHHALPEGGYEIAFSPVLEGFGEDDEKDALAWNAFLEANVRKYPAHYLWAHKRFKTRPEGAPSIY